MNQWQARRADIKKKTKSEAILEAFIYILNFLLQRNEAGRMSGSNTWTTVFNRLVCDGELSKIMTNHLRLKRENYTNHKPSKITVYSFFNKNTSAIFRGLVRH